MGMVVALWSGLAGCGAWETVPDSTLGAQQAFEVPKKQTATDDLAALRAFSAEEQTVYRLGSGDEIFIEVAGRPELSGKHLIGPDGQLTLPIAGPVQVGELSREAAANVLLKALEPYYLDLAVTVRIERYGSNRVIVLGRVENPGVLRFDTPPTLLEALAQAGGLPLLRKEQLLTRCAVIRGDRILWVDLKRLLTGDLALNIRLQRDDVVYIPDAFDTAIYVLGAVLKPGAYRLTPQMSFLDALGQAGGPNVDANIRSLHVIRPSAGLNLSFAMEELLQPNPTLNVALEEGDILYVPRSGVAKVGYILDRLNPFSTLFSIQQLGGTTE
ncbi:MAG: polysaccharide export protein [Candidatus Competibacteraceae bacterium]|nr:polysaccharide export protein [Candidatus Competibacteraceae bacterium]